MIAICVDDYGENVFRCHWSEKLTWASQAIFTGGFYPGVKTKYLSHPEYYAEARKISSIAFHESERNCNSCKHLERQKHDKNISGFLYGKCRSVPVEHPYQVENGSNIKFHPDDWMGMKCYETRFS